MERTILLLLTCTAVEGFVGRHIFVNQVKNWLDAQIYCRDHHTDLSFISSQSDQDRFILLSKAKQSKGWIGLEQDPNNKTAWKWSGGGNVTYQNWNKGEPSHPDVQDRGYIWPYGKWNDLEHSVSLPFYCIQINVVEEEKSWEEALEHCREHHVDLTSLLYETENLLALKEIKSNPTTERVWIGLRYLGDRWLWVNGDPLEYEAWPKGGVQDHQCPIWKRCGALTKDGLWENWDCQDKLSFICF